jgi:hypothetical protein
MISSALDAARAALRGEPGPRVLSRTDHAPPVAFLVTLARTDGDLIVPLRAGGNFVGRGHGGNRPYGTWPDPIAVEGAQWCIECGSGGAEVWDAASTNLSVVLPSTLAAEVNLGVGFHGFERLFELPGALPLPHPNVASDRHRYPLAEGDVLRGCYAAFAFGWLREKS